MKSAIHALSCLISRSGVLVSSLTPTCRVVNDNIHRQGNYAYVTAPAAKSKGVWGELGLANKGCSSLA